MTEEKQRDSGHIPSQINNRSGCIDAINAIVNGDLDRWRGLPSACTRADVETVLSSVTREVNESSPYSGPMSYAPAPGAPYGLTVHYGVGTVEYISVVEPRFKRTLQEMLGEPEGKIQSHLEGASEQWVYPGLGLAFHMNFGEQGVNRLYVFSPTSLEVYKTSLLSRVRTLRHKKR